MGLVRTIMSGLGIEGRARVTPGAHPSDDGGWWGRTLRGPTSAGIDVDEWVALSMSTVWCCVGAIAADVSKLPVHLYQREDGDGYRTRVRKHPAAVLLQLAANSEASVFTVRELITSWALLWGNGCAEIERNRRGDPIALWPLKPWRMWVRRLNGEVVYDYLDEDGKSKKLPAEDVLHIRGLGGHTLCGFSVVRFAREAMGGVYAVDEYGRRFFGNGGQPSAILSHPGTIGREARIGIRDDFDAMHQGPDRSHNVAVLEEGMTLEKWSVPPEDGQFLQTRQFNVPEICRWFRFPPHKAGDLTRATFSNIEQSSLDYLGDTLQPWMVRWEQELNRKLLTPTQQDRLYFEHLADAILRTDVKSRSEAYDKAIKGGWMSPDEVRSAENRPPIPNGAGRIWLVPTNMTTPAKLKADEDKALEGDEPTNPTPPAPPADPPPGERDPAAERSRLVAIACNGQLEVVAAALRRLGRTLGDKAQRAAKREADWTEFRAAVLTDIEPARRELLPAVEAALAIASELASGRSSTPAPALAGELAAAWCERSVELAGGLPAEKAEQLGTWDRTRPEREAGELVRALAHSVTGAWRPEEDDRG